MELADRLTSLESSCLVDEDVEEMKWVRVKRKKSNKLNLRRKKRMKREKLICAVFASISRSVARFRMLERRALPLRDPVRIERLSCSNSAKGIIIN